MIPIVTITLISIVSLVLLVALVYAIVHFCGKTGSKDKKKAKHEELDRFLGPEESEDEYISGVVTEKVPSEETYNKAFADSGTFHYVEENSVVPTDVKSEVKESDSVSVGVDEVAHVGIAVSGQPEESSIAVDKPEDLTLPSESTEITVPSESVLVTVDDTVPLDAIVTLPEVSSTPDEPAVESSIETTSVESPATLAVPSPIGSRDDLDIVVHSDDPSNIPAGSTISRRKKLSLGKLSRSTQRIYSSFSEKAKVKISMQYIGSVKCLKGNIISIEGLDLNAEHCPQEISFHLRFFPNKKFHMATKNKPIFEDVDIKLLNLTFTMGPVFAEDLTNNTLRVKLYGKKTQRLTMSKCYGECSLHLEDIVGKSEPTEFIEVIAQRSSGSGTYSSDSDGVM